MKSIELLTKKSSWVRIETLKLHKRAPGTRLASSLSDVEIFVAMYYGRILRYDPKDPQWPDRDRFIISKGHGAISLYPILADLNYFDISELEKIGTEGSILGSIPDAVIPGFETTNGSLGHGLGVACGMALALRTKKSDSKVYVLCGDGELNSGAIWEAVMFAGFHKLHNLNLIIDNNKMSMLGYQKDILGLDPYEEKFATFGWKTQDVDGNNMQKVYNSLVKLKEDESKLPKVLIANTVKGKGVEELEMDRLSHVKTFTSSEVDMIIKRLK